MTVYTEVFRNGISQGSLDEILSKVASPCDAHSRRTYDSILGHAYNLLKKTYCYWKPLIDGGIKDCQIKGLWEGVTSDGQPIVLVVKLRGPGNGEVGDVLTGVCSLTDAILGWTTGIPPAGGVTTFYVDDYSNAVQRPS